MGQPQREDSGGDPYAAILREVITKGPASRFQKTEPGKFAATTMSGGGDPSTAPVGVKVTKPKKVKRAQQSVDKTTTPGVVPTSPDGTPGPQSTSA